MDLGLNGKAAIVTGGSQGIGKAVARALAAEGVRVAICGRRQELLNEAALEIQSRTGMGVLSVQADISNPADTKRLVAEAADSFGRVDILVNNAASFQSAPFLKLSDEEWLNHFNMKFLGSIRCIREVLPHMKNNHWGRIINIGGISARQAGSSGYLSGAVNSAIVNLTKKLSDEVAPFNITANAIHPGATNTGRREKEPGNSAKKRDTDAAAPERQKFIPIGRLIEPEDIAYTILFVASERASAMTGQVLTVDGGAARGVYY